MIKQKNMLGVAVPYPGVFRAYRYMYLDQHFNKGIGDRTVRQTDQKKLWLYLAAFRCETNKQNYKLIR